jgi:hypothetical protein
VHQITHAAAKAGIKKRCKITESLLAEAYVQITRRGVEKVMKRTSTNRTAGYVARLGQLTTPGWGATPFPGQPASDLSPEEIRRSLRISDQVVDTPTETNQADSAAARARLMSGWPTNAPPGSRSPNHSSDSGDEC